MKAVALLVKRVKTARSQFRERGRDESLDRILEKLRREVNKIRKLFEKCYLLEGMPKGIEKLTQLQVLEGYAVGNSRESQDSISELANLKNLRRLSIHIGSEAVIEDGEFESWRGLSLEHLKISWGQEIPEWLKPSKLPEECKELKLMGGKLKSFNHGENLEWRLEIVRIGYLKDLKVGLANFPTLFPSLSYAEIKQKSKTIEIMSVDKRNAKETLSVELVKYCYGDKGIAGSSLVYLRKCLEEEFILREVFGGSVSSFVKIQRRCCFISCGFKRGVF
ncbi:uncharacterized protein HKW66_Vig0112640 [Vigna angularis]|uniref:Uncharacterized protein n=1 Tax=Phaseolus angularis TaxID=3914 RepID=A0A8T0KYM6_PHAAN|nr:uncharacterized protein HKW66_Vig0112640 [Vigna angularis]